MTRDQKLINSYTDGDDTLRFKSEKLGRKVSRDEKKKIVMDKLRNTLFFVDFSHLITVRFLFLII